MTWLSLALIAFIVSLGITFIFSGNSKRWPLMRFLALLAFEVGGVLVATLALVTLAYLGTAPSMTSTNPTGVDIRAVLHASQNTLLLVAAALIWSTLTGLGGAFWFTLARRRSGATRLAAGVLWVIPTFLLAIAVQEVQAEVYNVTGLAISGGYSQVSTGQVFWGAIVLGVRPAAYVFRQARIALAEAGAQEYVRAARAKGLPWGAVARRHVLRPTLPVLAVAWLVSLRLMIGSLPLVEYFFSYPGLGNRFLASIGLGGALNADEAIAAVAILAGAFLIVEAAINVFQQALDPRLRETRLGAETVS